MAAAGIIAAFGVIYDNGILIVGAMAISPDTLPVTATCTGRVVRRWALAGRAFATLTIGLAFAGLVAGAMTLALNALELLPAGFEVGAASLQGLTTVSRGRRRPRRGRGRPSPGRARSPGRRCAGRGATRRARRGGPPRR